MDEAKPMKVIIVGAGIGGLVCAIASRRQGLDVVVLEKVERLTPVCITLTLDVRSVTKILLGAGIQIPANASRICAELGLLDRLKEVSVISEAAVMRRWENGEHLCSRSIGESMDERCPWLVIHRADYQQILVEECEHLGVELRLNCDIVSVDFDTTKVITSEHEEIWGDVIIGADGLWSSLRAQILGHPSPPQATGDLAYRGTFPLSVLQALKDPAIDELCGQKIVTIWVGPNSHAVFYPVRSGKEFNLVLIRPDDLPPDVRTQEGNLEELRALFEGWDPVLTKILTGFSTVLKWKMLHHDELPSWTKNNVALLGDACHPSLPYQAQGAAMAVEDGTIIATLLGRYEQCVSASQPHPSLPETLKLYEKLQKARTTTMRLGTISNRHLYHLEDGPEQEERDRVLKAAQWKKKTEGESERFIWLDFNYQNQILGRDSIAEANTMWEEAVSKREL